MRQLKLCLTTTYLHNITYWKYLLLGQTSTVNDQLIVGSNFIGSMDHTLDDCHKHKYYHNPHDNMCYALKPEQVDCEQCDDCDKTLCSQCETLMIYLIHSGMYLGR